MTTCVQPATGSKVSHFYVAETVCGTTPANPAWKPFRFTSGNMQLTKDSLQSSELDGSREIADLRLGSNQTAGEIAVELAYGAYDDILEAALGGTWATYVAESASVTVSATLSKFTRATGSYVSQGVKAGDLIQFQTLTGDNAKVFQVKSVTATEVVVHVPAHMTLTVETATTDIKRGDQLAVGSDRRSFSILTNYADADGGAGIYQITKGVEISGWSFDVSVNALVTGSFPTIGRETAYDVALPSGSTFPSVTKKAVYSAVDGTIVSDDVILAFVTSGTMTCDNAASAQFELGSNDVSFIERGRINNTLSLSTFFTDATLLTQFINETETKLSITLQTNSGLQMMAFNYGRIVYTSGTPDVAGEGSIVVSLDAQALQGAALESSLIIQRL